MANHVAHAAEHDFDAVALLSRGNRVGGTALAFYSDASGSYARQLGADGSPTPGSAPLRLGERCAGGMAALERGNGAQVACLRPGDGLWLTLVVSPSPGVISVGPTLRQVRVGAASRGVAMRAHGAGFVVVHHDADAQAHRLWLHDFSANGNVHDGIRTRQLGPAGAVAGAPALFALNQRLYAAYVTWELDAQASRSTLHVEDAYGDAHVRIPLQHHDPTPRLSTLGGELLLSYRDRPSPRARLEQFTQRLSPELVLQGERVRMGRASGSGGPTLTRCGDTVFSAAPIEHGSELYVIFHALDPALAARDPNHQCYATERSFVSAADACSGDDLLALVAEETDPSGKPAELLGMRFSCAR
jgi:hypothetical protein